LPPGRASSLPPPRGARAAEHSEARKSIKKVILIPLKKTNAGVDSPDAYGKEIDAFNANLSELVRDNTGLLLLPLREEVRKQHQGNPIAVGRALGADAVLTGLIHISPLDSVMEQVTVSCWTLEPVVDISLSWFIFP
jgi:hypothetical protein